MATHDAANGGLTVASSLVVRRYGFSVKYAPLDDHSAGLHNVTDAAHGVSLLGTPVYVRYPHPLQGLAVSIVDARRELVWVPPSGYDGVGLPSVPGSIKERPHSAETARDFRLLSQKAQRTLLSGGMGLTTCGMDIGACLARHRCGGHGGRMCQCSQVPLLT